MLEQVSTLENNNNTEQDSMSDIAKPLQVLLDNITPSDIGSPVGFDDNTISTSFGIDVPEFVDNMPDIGAKSFELNLEATSSTYDIGDPSLVNPDMSRGVILKSILTRKSPVKNDMANNPEAFNSGIDLLRYEIVFQPANLVLNEGEIAPQTEPARACVFCGKDERKIGTQVVLPQITKAEDVKKVFHMAKALEDKELERKLLQANDTWLSHDVCRVEYRNRHTKITRKNSDAEERQVIKNLESKVFAELFAFMKVEIMEKNKTYFLIDLFERYKAILSDMQNATTLVIHISNIQTFEEVIAQHFDAIITIDIKAKKKVVYKTGNTEMNSAFMENENTKYDRVAFELRREIKSLKRHSDGKIIENEIPEKLLRFVSSLTQGPYVSNTSEDNIKIKEFCQQIVKQVNED